MPTLSVSNVLCNHGFSPLSDSSGLTKNMRKRRNRKIKHAAAAGGAGGLSSLFASSEFNSYIDPMRLKKSRQKTVVSTRLSSLPGFSETTMACGGWGRLPNVATIHYADDDPRGWVSVGRNRRNRSCMIRDDEHDEYYEGN